MLAASAKAHRTYVRMHPSRLGEVALYCSRTDPTAKSGWTNNEAARHLVPECCDIVGIICGCTPSEAKWPSAVDASADVLATEEVSMKFRESNDESAPVPLIELIPVNEGDVGCPRGSVDCSELCRPFLGLPAISDWAPAGKQESRYCLADTLPFPPLLSLPPPSFRPGGPSGINVPRF